jgi:hypothetical protein
MLHEVEAEIVNLKRVADVLRSIASNGSQPRGERRSLSAAARKKISLAQKARWAKSATDGQDGEAMKPKRTMSVAARKKIAAAQRLRWAKARAQSKKAA